MNSIAKFANFSNIVSSDHLCIYLYAKICGTKFEVDVLNTFGVTMKYKMVT